MKYIKCKCFNCNEEFDKIAADYKRTERQNKRHFCSRHCSAIIAAKENYENGIFKPCPQNLKPANKKDEYTPFRWFYARARNRAREGKNRGDNRKPTNLTVEYLKMIWDKQEGKCPFTGWSMELPLGTGGWKETSNPRRASLDRIDNSKGYVEGNVRFISVIANYARNGFTDNEVMDFCRSVTERTK